MILAVLTFSFITIGTVKKNFERKNCDYFLTYQFKHVSWVLKELSHRDSSFEYPQHMLWLRIKKINFLLGTLITGPDN